MGRMIEFDSGVTECPFGESMPDGVPRGPADGGESVGPEGPGQHDEERR